MWEAHDLPAKVTSPSHKIRSPKVSVIIPTCNRPEFLSEALLSVFSQTYMDIEVIVVNDGGTEVESIIASLNKKRKIIYINCDDHRGPSAARNAGIKAARGKYIAYLDDDDIYYPDHIETLVNFLENNEYKAAYTDACCVHQEREGERYVAKKREVLYSFDFDPDLMLIKNFIPVLTVMHEKSCIDEVGLFDESLRTHEDWDLWIRMSRRFKFTHIKKITCEYTRRRDGTSATYEKRKNFSETQKMIHQRYRIYLKDKPWLSAAQEKHRDITYAQDSIDYRVTPISIKTRPETIYNKVSVIVPLQDNYERLTHFLVKIRSQKKIQDIEIIVIDSGLSENSGRTKKEFGANVIYIPGNEFGYKTIYNIGVKEASGEFLVFAVQDAIPVNDYWLYNMIGPFLEYPELSALSARQFARPKADLFSLWMTDAIARSLDLERDYFIFSSLSDRDKVNHSAFDSLTKEKLKVFDNMLSCFRKSAIEKSECISLTDVNDIDLAVELVRKGKGVGYLTSTGVYCQSEIATGDVLKRHYTDTKGSNKVILYFFYAHRIALKALLRDITEAYELTNTSIAGLKIIEDNPVMATRSFLAAIQENIDAPDRIKNRLKEGTCVNDDGLGLLVKQIAGNIVLPSEQKYTFKQNVLLSDLIKRIGDFTEYLCANHPTFIGREKDFISCIYKIFAMVAGDALGVFYLESESLNRLTPDLKRIDHILDKEAHYF